MTAQGYCGSNYDRFVENTNTSTLHKMKETYWTTKQAVMQKLGKKEDEHVVASDSQLDAKLEVFKAIQKSSMDLLRVIERYQDRLCAVAQEENATGRFLKSHSGHDKTRAGKMMAAVGKSQSFSAQQRLALRVPLVRLYQEVETFRYRAISDTLVTVNRMEGARTEYRGALLWMKNVSEELDPDTYKQLEKFRKVQGQVRKTKQRFDKLKLDVMQKVDLLAASRCNMFSHVLANYQSTLLHFWKKTSRTMSAVAESFKGYQYYEFNMLKELTDTSRKLADETSSRDSIEKDTEEASDAELSDDEMINVSFEEGEEKDKDDEELYREFEDRQHRKRYTSDYQEAEADRLLSLDDKEATSKTGEEDNKKEQNASSEGQSEGDFGPFMDFHDDEDTMKELEEELERAEKMISNVKAKSAAEQQKQPAGGKDLLTPTQEQEDADKDDLSLLNEILNAPSTGEDEFTQEWQAVFGAQMNITPDTVPAERDLSRRQAEFMPSSLLDTQLSALNLGDDMSAGDMMMGEAAADSSAQAGQASSGQPSAAPKSKQQQPPKKGQKTDMSAWFNLFADLDPLSNPDAVGRQPDDMIGEL
ncbi:islet cell autoantigen 1-like isoform X1 [Littorina saxatilis]|uniref:islet cell autoantigen 1-like isoform X1 n=1 Tax=Littorina saxatilis TaxID=31220 RepID=UPI0038B49CCD